MAEPTFFFEALGRERHSASSVVITIARDTIRLSRGAFETLGQPEYVTARFCRVTRTLGIFPCIRDVAAARRVISKNRMVTISLAAVQIRLGLKPVPSYSFPARPYENGLIVSLPSPAVRRDEQPESEVGK